MRRISSWLILLVFLGACASGTTSTTTTLPDVTTAASTPSSQTAPTSSAGTVAPSTTAVDEPAQIVIAEGAALGGPLQLVVSLGEEVVITVNSDVDNEVHVHGYDLGFEVGPGQPSEIRFVADVPGIFEIELHDANHTVIAEVTVS